MRIAHLTIIFLLNCVLVSLISRAVRLHERSRFVREAGRWFYVDGDQF